MALLQRATVDRDCRLRPPTATADQRLKTTDCLDVRATSDVDSHIFVGCCPVSASSSASSCCPRSRIRRNPRRSVGSLERISPPSAISSTDFRRCPAPTTCASTCGRSRRSRTTPALLAAGRSRTTSSAKFKSWGLNAQIEEFEALMPYPTERVVELVGPGAVRREAQGAAGRRRRRFERRGAASDLQRLLGRRRRHGRSRLRELRHSRGLRAAREARRSTSRARS